MTTWVTAEPTAVCDVCYAPAGLCDLDATDESQPAFFCAECAVERARLEAAAALAGLGHEEDEA